MKIAIGPARQDELPLVLCTWKRSAWRLPVNRHYHASGRYGKGRFFTAANAGVQRILDSGAMVLVARDADDPAFAYGWLVAGLVGDVLAGYYAFVKEHFRELGIMRQLRDQMVELVPDDARLVYCEHSPHDATWERWGFQFRSVEDVLGEQRRSA